MNISELLNQFKNKTILVIGDAMVDKYIWGSVKRISPEAPVPIVHCQKETLVPGGAANVSANIISLGGKCIFVSIVGKDEYGKLIINKMKEIGIDCSCIIESETITTQKIRVMGENQQLVRIDYEEKLKDNKKNQIIEFIEKRLDQIDIIIISDYDKGLITKSLAEEIIRFDKKVIVDPKPQNMIGYKNAFLIKPNKSEIEEFFHKKFETEEELINHGFKMAGILESNILITRGKDGMSLFEKQGTLSHICADKKEVYDVTGAGDTVTAALALAIASGTELSEAISFANKCAGIKVLKRGTATVSANELLSKEENKDENGSKLKSRNKIIAIAKQLKKDNKKIAFTNGCFDIIHAGHVHILQKAKENGDVLILGLNSDISIKKNKGELRPIICEHERVQILSALSCIDHIVLFDEITPFELIKEIQPDVIVKGGDYTKETVCGSDFIESHGGKTIIIPRTNGSSTTNIINKILEQEKK